MTNNSGETLRSGATEEWRIVVRRDTKQYEIEDVHGHLVCTFPPNYEGHELAEQICHDHTAAHAGRNLASKILELDEEWAFPDAVLELASALDAINQGP